MCLILCFVLACAVVACASDCVSSGVVGICCLDHGRLSSQILSLRASSASAVRPQVKISPGGGFLAYTLQLGPSEACAGRVRDLATGTFPPAGELASVVSLEWADEGATLLYTQPDELGRPYKVRRADFQGAWLRRKCGP